MPKGYIVAELATTQDNAEFTVYRNQARATVEAYGGRFLVAGGQSTLLEGEEPLGVANFVLEFDSPEQAMAWYHSPAYQDILPLRLRNATGRLICTAGT